MRFTGDTSRAVGETTASNAENCNQTKENRSHLGSGFSVYMVQSGLPAKEIVEGVLVVVLLAVLTLAVLALLTFLRQCRVIAL